LQKRTQQKYNAFLLKGAHRAHERTKPDCPFLSAVPNWGCCPSPQTALDRMLQTPGSMLQSPLQLLVKWMHARV